MSTTGKIGGKRASGLLIVSRTTDAGLDTQAKGSSALLVLLQPALLASLATTEGESTGKALLNHYLHVNYHQQLQKVKQ